MGFLAQPVASFAVLPLLGTLLAKAQGAVKNVSIRLHQIDHIMHVLFANQINPCTLPETNIVPENRLSPKETSIPTIHFQVLC